MKINKSVLRVQTNKARLGSGGGSGGSTQTVQKADPWPEQQPYLTYGFEQAQQQYESPKPTYFPGPTTVPFDPLQVQAQEGMLSYLGGPFVTGSQGQAESLLMGNLLSDPYNVPITGISQNIAPLIYPAIAKSMGQTGQYFNPYTQAGSADISGPMSSILSGEVQNPYVSQMVDVMGQNLAKTYTEQIAPSIRAGGTMYQPGGSSRGDIIQGMAARGISEELARGVTGLYGNLYENALGRQLAGTQLATSAGLAGKSLEEQIRTTKAGEALRQSELLGNLGLQGQQLALGQIGQGLASYPGVAGQQISLLDMLSSIGAQRRGLSQEELEADITRHEFEQGIDQAKLAQYMGLIQGNYGGTTATSGTQNYPSMSLGNRLAPLAAGVGGALLPGAAGALATGTFAPASATLMGMGPWGWAALAGLGTASLLS